MDETRQLLTIAIGLPANRDYVGTLRILDGAGRDLAGPFRVAARASDEVAAAHGNPTRATTLPYGDPPVGRYKYQRMAGTGAGTKYRQDLFGAVDVIVLAGIAGDAALADANGRFEIIIHGGPLSADGRLRASAGHFRVSDPDLKEVSALLRRARAAFCVCKETCTDDKSDTVADTGISDQRWETSKRKLRNTASDEDLVAYGEYSPNPLGPDFLSISQTIQAPSSQNLDLSAYSGFQALFTGDPGLLPYVQTSGPQVKFGAPAPAAGSSSTDATSNAAAPSSLPFNSDTDPYYANSALGGAAPGRDSLGVTAALGSTYTPVTGGVDVYGVGTSPYLSDSLILDPFVSASAHHQYSIGFNVVGGGNLFLVPWTIGPFIGGGVSIGVTDEFQLFIQFQGNLMVGYGIYAGYGIGVARTSSQQPVADWFSTAGFSHSEGDIGLGSSFGASFDTSLTPLPGESTSVGASPFYKLGEGFGGFIGTGRGGELTIATPSPLPPLEDLLEWAEKEIYQLYGVPR